jgi:hypothetical protein
MKTAKKILVSQHKTKRQFLKQEYDTKWITNERNELDSISSGQVSVVSSREHGMEPSDYIK